MLLRGVRCERLCASTKQSHFECRHSALDSEDVYPDAERPESTEVGSMEAIVAAEVM